MKSKTLCFTILLWLSLISISKSVTYHDLNVNNPDHENKSGEKEYYYKVEWKTITKYLKIQTQGSLEGGIKPAYIYLSNTKDPSIYNFLTLSRLNSTKNVALINKDTDTYYLKVECPAGCQYKISVESSDDLTLEKGERFTYIALEENNMLNVDFKIRREKDSTDAFNIFFVGGSDDDISFSLKYADKQHKFLGQGVLFNGDIAYIDELNKYPYVDGQNEYIIKIEAQPKTQVTIGSRVLDDLSQEIVPDGQAIYGFLADKNDKHECFRIQKGESEDENSEIGINVISRGKNCRYYFTNDPAEPNLNNGEKYKEGDVINHAYIRYTKKEREAYEYMCFESTDGQGVAFSVFANDIKPRTQTKPMIEPIINGIEYFQEIYPGAIQVYRHSKHLTTTNETSFNVRRSDGNINVYVHFCEQYPNCLYSKAIIEEKIKGKNFYNLTDIQAFYNFAVEGKNETNLFDEQQYLLIVHCVGGERAEEIPCEYSVSFSDENDKLIITNDTYYPQVMSASQQDQFAFDIVEDNLAKVVVTLNTLTGDSSMEISTVLKNIEKTTFFSGNTEITEITSKNSEDLKGAYTVKIIGTTSNFYTISYHTVQIEEVKDINLGSGVTLLQVGFPGETFNFVAKNFYQDEVSPPPFVFTVQPVNCVASAVFINSVKQILPLNNDTLQHNLLPNDPNYNDAVYRYAVTVNDKKGITIGKYCSFYVSAVELYGDQELLVNEGAPFTFLLDKNIPKLRLIYPHPPELGNVMAVFNIESSELIQTKVFINNKEDKTIKFITSRRLLTDSDKFKENCYFNQLCPIVFEITYLGEDQAVLETIIRGQDRVPQYLKRNKLRNDVFFTSTPQYYIFEVELDNEGEVVVNFDSGSGKIFGRVVEKEAVEEGADWNGKVILPKEGMKDLVSDYDQYTKTLTFTKADTRKCQNGCDFYIALVSGDNHPEEKDNTFSDEFSIFVRTGNTVLDINTGEYIVDRILSVGTDVFDSRFYRFDSPNDQDVTYIEMMCKTCVLDIFKGTQIPVEGQEPLKTFRSAGVEQVFEFEHKISEDQAYMFRVRAEALDSGYATVYQLRVLTPKKELPYNLIQISADQSTLCKTDVNGYCNFLLPLDVYDEIGDFFIYAIGDIDEELVIGANVIEGTSYQKMKPEEIKKEIPRYAPGGISDAKFSSSSEINKNVLTITSDVDHDKYLLISIKGKKESTIKVLTALKTFLHSMLPNAAKVQAFIVGKGETFKFDLPNDRDYTVHVMSIEGSASVALTTESGNKYELKGIRDYLTLDCSKEKKESLNIKTSSEKDFKFFFWLSVRNNGLEEIKYGETGEFGIPNPTFPLKFYSEFSLTEESEFGIECTDGIQTTNNYTVEGCFVNSFDIFKSDFKCPTPIKGKFDKFTKTGRLVFSKELFTSIDSNKPKYAFISVNNEGKDKVNLLRCEVSLVVSGNPKVPVPEDKFVTGQLEKDSDAKIFLLKKSVENSQGITFFKLAFIGSSDLDIAILEEADLTQRQNSTSFTFKDLGPGRRASTFSSNKNNTYLLVFSKKASANEEGVKPFSFKYQTSETEQTAKGNLHNNILDKNSNGEEISFDLIQDQNGDVVEADYLLKIYDGIIKDAEDIGLTSEATKAYTNPEIKDKKGLFKVGSIKNNSTAVLTATTKEDKDVFTYKKLEFAKDQTQSKSLIIIIIICSIIVALIVVAIVCLISRKGKESLKSNVDHTSFAADGQEPILAD